MQVFKDLFSHGVGETVQWAWQLSCTRLMVVQSSASDLIPRAQPEVIPVLKASSNSWASVVYTSLPQNVIFEK